MNELQIFNNPQFGEIRTLTENGKTLFCGKDVAAALGYKDTTNAMKQHCRGVVKRHPPPPGVRIELVPPTPPLRPLLRPPGAGWCLYPPATLGAFVGWLWPEIG